MGQRHVPPRRRHVRPGPQLPDVRRAGREGAPLAAGTGPPAPAADPGAAGHGLAWARLHPAVVGVSVDRRRPGAGRGRRGHAAVRRRPGGLPLRAVPDRPGRRPAARVRTTSCAARPRASTTPRPARRSARCAATSTPAWPPRSGRRRWAPPGKARRCGSTATPSRATCCSTRADGSAPSSTSAPPASAIRRAIPRSRGHSWPGRSRRIFTERLPFDAATWARGRGWAIWKAMIVLVGQLANDPAGADETKHVIERNPRRPSGCQLTVLRCVSGGSGRRTGRAG